MVKPISVSYTHLVVYTKEAETADQYIEKTVHKIGRENQVTVATSDGLEPVSYTHLETFAKGLYPDVNLD